MRKTGRAITPEILSEIGDPGLGGGIL